MNLASSISVVTYIYIYSLSYLCSCRVNFHPPTKISLQLDSHFEFTLPKKVWIPLQGSPCINIKHKTRIRWHADDVITLFMNFLQTGWISLDSEALNIITCFSWGVIVNISWISRRMSTEMKCSNSFYCMCIQQHIQSCSSILSHSSNIKCFM